MTIKFGENQDVNVSNRINAEHLTINTDLIYTDGTNVGIGTTNPNEKLHVAGNVNVNDAMLLYSTVNNAIIANKNVIDNPALAEWGIVISGSGSVYLNKPAGQTLNILTGQSSNVLVASDDSVGIGLFPTQKLDVNGNIKSSGTLIVGTNPSSGSIGQLLVSKGSDPPEWETITTGGGGASALNDLNDVNITTLVNTHVLKYTGSAWVNESVNVNEINGIDLTQVGNNELLRKDGANNSVVGADIITTTSTGGGVTSQKTQFLEVSGGLQFPLSSIESKADNGIYSMFLNPYENNANQKGMTLLAHNNNTRVGINVANPTEDLEIDGNIQLDSNNQSRIIFYDTQNDHEHAEIDALGKGTNGGQLIFKTKNDGGSVTEKMRITDDGALGIGLVPTQKLEVNGNIKVANKIIGTNNDLFLYTSTTGPNSYGFLEMSTFITSLGASQFRILTGSDNTTAGSESLRILANGNVGIGTTNPLAKLEVVGETRIHYANGSQTNFNFEQSNLNNIAGTSTVFEGDITVNGDIDVLYGDVGIGTANPTEKLEVNGNIKINYKIHSTNNQLEIYPNTNATNSYSWIEMRTDKFALGAPKFEFYSGSTDASVGSLTMSITNTGEVGINKISPTEKLDVNGNIKADNLFLGANGQTPKIDMLFIDHNSGIESDTRIEIGSTNDMPGSPAFPPVNAYGMNIKANSDAFFIGLTTYDGGSNYKPLLKWGDDITDTPFRIEHNNHDLSATNHYFEFGTDGNYKMSGNNFYINEYAGIEADLDGNGPYLAFYTKIIDGPLSEKMRITTDGNVGIGTTNPVAKLEINGGELRLTNNNGSQTHFNHDNSNQNYIRGSYTRIDSQLAVVGSISADNLFLGTPPGQTPKIDMFFIDHANTNTIYDTKIEIGKSDDFTNSPAYPPSNAYGMNIQANSDGVFLGISTYDGGNNWKPLLKWGDDAADTPFRIAHTNGTAYFNFERTGDYKMSGDNFFINDIGHKRKSASAYEIEPNLGWTGNKNARSILVLNQYNASLRMIHGNGSEITSISPYENGTIYHRGNFVGVSDDRLKSYETDVSNATDTILKLKPKFYKKHPSLITDDPTPDLSGVINYDEYGFIAQELNEDPELSHFVSQHPETEIYHVNYTEMIPLLVQTIKELNDRIKVLEGAI